MTILLSENQGAPSPIIVSRPEEAVDLDQLGHQLADLARRRRITARDEQLIELLLAAGLLSLDQIRRLLWPHAKTKTAADRLSKLWQWRILRRARQPWPRFASLGLNTGPIFGLGPGGWCWFDETEPDDYPYWLIDRPWVRQQLLAAELFTRFLTQPGAVPLDWRARWQGWPKALAQTNPIARFTLRPPQARPRTFNLELAVVDSFDLAKKLPAYDRLAEGGSPVTVALVFPHDVPRHKLADAIQQQRRQPVTYLLADWHALRQIPDPLTSPCWHLLQWQTQPRQAALLEAASDA